MLEDDIPIPYEENDASVCSHINNNQQIDAWEDDIPIPYEENDASVCSYINNNQQIDASEENRKGNKEGRHRA